MAKPRLVQAGIGSTRPLVVVFHAASVVDAKLKAACGPRACIVNYSAEPMKGNYRTVGENGLPSVVDIGRDMGAQVNAQEFDPVVVVGFSEGCMAIRAQLTYDMKRHATSIHGVVAVDGVHSSKPIPEAYTPAYNEQIQPWFQWLSFSDWGKNKTRASVFTHTLIDPPTYTSVRETLAFIFGVDSFGKGLNDDSPAVLQQENVEVWSFPGNAAKDHSKQLLRQLPRALNRVLVLLGELDDNGPESQALEALIAKGGGAPLDKIPAAPKPKTPNGGGGGSSSGVSWLPLALGLGAIAAVVYWWDDL